MTKAVSIIILCHGRWERTRRCLESLRRSTPSWLYEVRVYDNASPDDTYARLLRLRRGWPQLKVFKNARNLTFAEGVNRAMRASTGRYYLWLNNDTVVAPGWLEGLVSAARSDEAIAAVGPMTEFMAPPPQLSSPFVTERMVHASSLPFLGGFCFLLKRRAAERIGLLDERFAWGWEDIDYCLRLRQAGWTLALARNVFVEHAGNATIKGMPPLERRATDLMNRRLLTTKWLRPEPGPGELGDLFDKSPAPWDDDRCPLASVVVLCSGDWARAQRCLNALRRRGSKSVFEVLAVDLSRGGRCLKRLEDMARSWPELTVLGRWDGAPYADAANRALARAQGQHFVLLSEDALVTPGWLDGLAAAARSAPNIGMTGPRTTGDAPPWQHKARGKITAPAGRLGGPCLLIPRAIFTRVGGFDERFTGETAHTDYGLRLLQAGYQLVVAGGVFVPRRGSGRRAPKKDADATLLFKKWAGNPLFLPENRR